MSRSLDDLYLDWLSSQIRIQNNSDISEFREVFELMLNTEFVWLIPNDDNREVDGLDLRSEFINYICAEEIVDFNYTPDEYMRQPVSFLEILIALSRRMAFNSSWDQEVCAGILFVNLGLYKFKNRLTPSKRDKIKAILENVIWRKYSSDGNGGFFPLAFPDSDQRETELWYQMCAFIEENPTL